ncbi:MAG: hypothetical protein V7641_206 [Blastocatellia bacterium]
MSRYRFAPLAFDGISTYPLASRPSKVTTADFARPVQEDSSLKEFFASLPNILAARELKELAERIRTARKQQRAIIIGLGGHVIKTGLAPVLIDLIERGYATAFAMNRAAMIHDFEIALAGQTSEDVDATLGSGQFGMAEETGRVVNEAIRAGARDGIGMGEALGRQLHAMNAAHANVSLLCAAYSANIPVTVHVAIGTDIVDLHPSAEGASVGQTTYQAFRLLCAIVRELDGGGVYLNLGSAVLLPEVFLKTVTVVRNLGHKLEDFTTANFDFLQHYRPLTNVVRRPVAGTGRGFAFTGHHEIMIPLLVAMILAE